MLAERLLYTGPWAGAGTHSDPEGWACPGSADSPEPLDADTGHGGPSPSEWGPHPRRLNPVAQGGQQQKAGRPTKVLPKGLNTHRRGAAELSRQRGWSRSEGCAPERVRA